MQTESQKKQQKQLILLGIIILITVGVFLFGRRGKKTDSPVALQEEAANTSIQSVNVSNIKKGNSELLSKNSFKNLQKNGEYPINVGSTGRDNPFAPYEEHNANE